MSDRPWYRYRPGRDTPVPALLVAFGAGLGLTVAALTDAGHPRLAAGLLLLVGGGALAWIVRLVREGRRYRRARQASRGTPAAPVLLDGDAALAEVNRLSEGGTSRFRTRDDGADPLTEGRLTLQGGFDLDRARDLELTFYGLRASTCPAELSYPWFTRTGTRDGADVFLIEDDEGRYEVVADGVAAEIATVPHGAPRP